MSAHELLALFANFLSISIFATGGAMALASDMHRYVVDEHHYITHTQFMNSIALAQAAPGPNMLFITIMGWQIAGVAGALATSCAVLTPALIFPMLISRAGRLPQFERLLKALKRGLSPIALGLTAATSFLLVRQLPGRWEGLAIIAVTLLLLAKTRVPPVLMIIAAGSVGAFVSW